MEKNSLTAVVITKNEEGRIKNCLDGLKFVDEIVVVDDFSKDETREIAEGFGAKVFKRKLDNFANQRNFALEKVQTEWVLLIDADEKVTSELASEIKQKVRESQWDGFWIPRRNFIFGKWIQHSGWYPDDQLHLFKTKKGKYFRQVHEQVKVDGNIGRLENHLIHENYQTLNQYLDKMKHYTVLESEHLVSSGYQFQQKDLFIAPTEEFLRRFFAEKGYLDGVTGLALCLLQAFSQFLVYLRIWERKNFPQENIDLSSLHRQIRQEGKKISFWFSQTEIERSHPFKKSLLKLKRKLLPG